MNREQMRAVEITAETVKKEAGDILETMIENIEKDPDMEFGTLNLWASFNGGLALDSVDADTIETVRLLLWVELIHQATDDSRVYLLRDGDTYSLALPALFQKLMRGGMIECSERNMQDFIKEKFSEDVVKASVRVEKTMMGEQK